MKKRICSKCKIFLPINSFYYNKKSKKYPRFQCIKCRKKIQKKYYFLNKEYIIGVQNKHIKNNPEKYRQKYLKGNKTIQSRYCRYRIRARKNNRTFKLTFKEFENILLQKCHYCKTNNRITIDRKNNNFGYTLKNSLPCCYHCNIRKKKQTYKKFINRKN